MIVYKRDECPEQVRQVIDYFAHQFETLPGRWWIAGGAVRDMYAEGRPGKDIDVFVPDDAEMQAVIHGLTHLPAFDGKLLRESKTVADYKTKVGTVQVVKNHFPTPEATLEQFDFTICCAAVVREGEKDWRLVVHDTFWIDLACRRLVVNALPYPLSSLERIQKFVRRGYRACNGTLLRFAQAIQRLNLEDPAQNQLEFYRSGTPRFLRID